VTKRSGINASAEVLNLIDKMLIKEPENRIELMDVLHHEWLAHSN
jgi:serine/threonine protein kinase